MTGEVVKIRGHFFLIAPALCLLFVLTGCGGFVINSTQRAQLTLSTSTLSFGNVAVHTTLTKALTITSSGDAALTVSSVTITGAEFTMSGAASFPTTVEAGQSLTVQVSFAPTTAAAASGTVTISTNSSSNNPTKVDLTGTGTASPNPQLAVSANVLDFGSVTVNSKSTRTLTLTSDGSSALTVSSVGLAGNGFAISGGSFPATLDPGQSVTLQVSFDPGVSGAATGTITISSNSGGGGISTVALVGTGTQLASPKLTLSAASIDFGVVSLNSSSTRALTLTSSGSAPLTIESASVAGNGFTIAGGTFPTALNPGESITLQVSFDPAAQGAATGAITISSNSSTGNSTTVALSGSATSSATPQLTVSPGSLSFGTVSVNATSTRTLTITSSGNAALTVNSVIAAGAGFDVSGVTFPRTLNPGQSVVLQVDFRPSAVGPANGTVTIASNSSTGNSSTVALSGTATATQTPELTLSANALAFGSVTVNTTSSQALTLTSSGTAALTVDAVTIAGGGFAISGATFPATLNPGESLTLQISFDPIVPGAANGMVSISSDSSSNSSTSVSLSGIGILATTPNLNLSAGSISFGNVTTNTTSTKTLTLTSSGTAALTINSVTLAGSSFTVSGATFPTNLNPGQSVSVQVSFDPASIGSATGALTISSNASSGNTSVVSLTGVGTAAASPNLTLSAGSISFGAVTLNTIATKTLTLTSSGTAALTVNSVTLAGDGFAISGVNFPTTLNPGQSVTLQVSFNPSATGFTTGTITVSSNASSGSTSTVSLTGTGTAAATPDLTLSAGSISFGNVTVNTTSTQTLTLTSSGTAALTINSVTLAGSGFAISGASFPTTLIPSQSLTLQVSFGPASTGSSTGTITVSSNASSGNTSIVSLTGTGTAEASPNLTLSAGSISFGNVTVNTTSTTTLTLTSSGTAALTINSATLAGSGFAISGVTFPTTLNPGQSVTLQVSFDPTAAGPVAGTITISSDSFNGNTTTISLSGTGVTNPVLSLSTRSLNFGDDPLNTTISLPVTLTSTGSSPVTVSGAAVSGAGFTFSGATFPVTLNPNIAITIQVQFDPTTAGSASGSLTFSSNSSTGTQSIVTLAGNGTSPAQHRVILTWTAPVNSPVPVSGYNVYRATGSSSNFVILNSSGAVTYVDLQVASGTQYTYYVTSFDSAGAESVPSNQVTATVP